MAIEVATIAIVSLTHYFETPPDPVQINAIISATKRISIDLGCPAGVL